MRRRLLGTRYVDCRADRTAADEQALWLVDLVVDEVDRAITRGRFLRGAVSLADGTPG